MLLARTVVPGISGEEITSGEDVQFPKGFVTFEAAHVVKPVKPSLALAGKLSTNGGGTSER